VTTPTPASSTPTSATPAGKNPRPIAAAAGGLFFPQTQSLGLDTSDYSARLQDKIVYAGITNSSFDAASADLAKLAGRDVGAKQVERLTKRIGLERVAERDEAVAAYQALPLVQRKAAPKGVTPPDVAVVGTDGGRIQILDRRQPATAAAEPAPPPVPSQAADGEHRGKHWREDKVGLLMAMTSAASAADPCPDIPEGFLEPARMGKLARQIRKGVPVTEEPVGDATDAVAEEQTLASTPAVWEPPAVQAKRLLGSRQSWEVFGPLVAAAAWAMGLFGAERRAFIGDGSENNWAVWRRFFSSFVPILDFIHALSYVYAAAHAGRDRLAGWKCYREWIVWVWRGQVGRVLAALGQRQQELGEPQEGDKESHPRQVVAQARAYLGNNAERMKYDEYRRSGLPIVSSYVESAVKQFNQRAKGTEKFWGEEGAEAILQLRGDHLSDDQPLDAFWLRRQAQATGQRPYRRVA
jgi:hypothetical protein